MNTSLERLYDAIGEPASWYAALEAFASDFDACIGSAALGKDLSSLIEAYLRLLQKDSGAIPSSDAMNAADAAFFGVGMPMHMVRSYCEHYWQLDDFSHAIRDHMKLQIRGTVCDGPINQTRRYRESPFYQDFMRPANFGGRVFGWERNPLHDERHFTLSMLKRSIDAVFDRHEVEQFNAAMPHLQRTAYLHAQTTLLQWKVQGLERVMDALPVGLLFVNTKGKLQHANQRARALMDRTVYPELEGFLQGGLQQSSAASALKKLFQRALAGHCGCTSLKATPDKPELTLLALSVRDMAHLGMDLGAPGVVFLLIERDISPHSAVQMAAQAYRLSAAESALLAHLLDGGTPVDFAEMRSVKITTVRTQLSSLLTKTGTQRQQDLLSLVARLMLVC